MARLQIDSLVQGVVGQTDRTATMRVTAIKPTFVVGIGEQGQQLVMYEPEVVDDPRPVAARRDIPSRFR